MRSRYEITLDNYCKVLHIEAATMLEMGQRDILPAAMRYSGDIAAAAADKQALSIDCAAEKTLAARLSVLCASLYQKIQDLEAAVRDAGNCGDVEACALYYKDHVFTGMQALRAVADELEGLTAKSYWPYPTYGDMLFSV